MFDFSNFLDVGDYLIEIPSEANVRSGISRYYYAGFGSVRFYLIEIMGEYEFVEGYSIHKRVCKRLMESDNNTESFIGEKLNDLRELRNKADYDWNLDYNYFFQIFGVVQKISRLIVEQVKSLKNSPPYKL